MEVYVFGAANIFGVSVALRTSWIFLESNLKWTKNYLPLIHFPSSTRSEKRILFESKLYKWSLPILGSALISGITISSYLAYKFLTWNPSKFKLLFISGSTLKNAFAGFYFWGLN